MAKVWWLNYMKFLGKGNKRTEGFNGDYFHIDDNGDQNFDTFGMKAQ